MADLSDFKRIRNNEWHASASVSRNVESAESCSCAASGLTCSTAQCINRALHVECDPKLCECRDACQNRRMQRGTLPKNKVQQLAGNKDRGMIAAEPISAGALVAEYIGEVISQAELARRMAEQYATMRHTYIMTYVRQECRGLLLDATVKGGMARFINHSCDANCETQKWIVRGETRVGIFATRVIRPGQEITYDYHLEWSGFTRIPCAPALCECGAAKCTGWLGTSKDTPRQQQQQQQRVLEDSDDDMLDDLYESDPDGGFTKVAQLDMPSVRSLAPDATGA